MIQLRKITTCQFILLVAVLFGNILSVTFAKRFKSKVDQIKSNASSKEQENAAYDVIKRFVPSNLQNKFQVHVDLALSDNTFQILHTNDTFGVVKITGSSGTSVTRGFHYYLKYFLNSHVSWDGNQLNGIHGPFPHVNLTIASPNKFIYYSNVCTHSYSFTWWQENDWRNHLDWMALQGINLFIAPIQEQIWTRVYRALKMTDDEINDHFAGPAYLAWQRMGNIRKWGGILSSNYKKYQLSLQKRIIKAARSLGMIIALPGFAGHVPKAFKRLFPLAKMTTTSRWGDFPDIFCKIYFLDSRDPYYKSVNNLYLKEIIKQYGTDHVYFLDPFNELEPPSKTPKYVRGISKGIYDELTAVDNNAVWLLQGWMFRYTIWHKDMIKAFLTANEKGSMMILDLQSDQYAVYDHTESYFGQPFIWCMLHNFGGALGMQGSLNIINERPLKAKEMKNSSMIGFGITMEGIFQNYFIYEFALEMGWVMEHQNIYEWIPQYIYSRYGYFNNNLMLAWDTLAETVYSYSGPNIMNGDYIFNFRPTMNKKPWCWYKEDLLQTVWLQFLTAADEFKTSSLFRHDLVDVTRQNFQIILARIYSDIKRVFAKQDSTTLALMIHEFQELLEDMDSILKTECSLTLGKWIENARQLAVIVGDEKIADLYESNARSQVTLWGPNAEINDYASKQWSGIVGPYYFKRWAIFFEELQKVSHTGVSVNETIVNARILKEVEHPFVLSRNYSTDCGGDAIEMSKILYVKWSNRIAGLMLPHLGRSSDDNNFIFNFS